MQDSGIEWSVPPGGQDPISDPPDETSSLTSAVRLQAPARAAAGFRSTF
jgi:hypothetical protein